MVYTSEDMTQVRLIDPADRPPGHDCVQGCQGMRRSDARPATTRTGPKVRLVDGGQHLGHAALEDPVAHTWHSQRAWLALARFGNGGAAHRRRSVTLRVHRPQRGFTPGPDILLRFVHGLSITPRRCLAWHLAAMVPQPLGGEMMGQTGKAALGLLPRVRCYPFESR
jgi:hypothetical protein